MTPSDPSRRARLPVAQGAGTPTRARAPQESKWAHIVADAGRGSGAEVLAGPLLWGGLGWLADGWLGTAPWLFSIGVMTGFVGGLYLVWLRGSKPVARATTPPPPSEPDEGKKET